MHIIVTGATGMAGAEVLRQAVADPEITSITAIVRSEAVIIHPKIKTIFHKNFLDYSGLEQVFRENDACIWCLGISQTQVSKEKYHEITYDYTIAAADAMLQANPHITFLFLSGAGADTTETSRTLFAKVKGKTENALMKKDFKKLFFARPAGIRPVHRNKKTPLVNQVMIPLFPIFEFLTPAYIINSAQLARAMLFIVKHETGRKTYTNTELKKIGNA